MNRIAGLSDLFEDVLAILAAGGAHPLKSPERVECG
jgi:hypothetical protein